MDLVDKYTGIVISEDYDGVDILLTWGEIKSAIQQLEDERDAFMECAGGRVILLEER